MVKECFTVTEVEVLGLIPTLDLVEACIAEDLHDTVHVGTDFKVGVASILNIVHLATRPLDSF